MSEKGAEMSRPTKNRRVCGEPFTNTFVPEKKLKETINTLTIDEYETIRLIDFEGYSQEECSKHMDVSRTTIQAIYEMARKKIADSLINGKTLVIAGGNYYVCDGSAGCPSCSKKD